MTQRASLWTGLSLLWLGGVVWGLGWLADYSNRPGSAATAPATWPVESRVAHDATRPTLLMLLHPRCACSRASVGELAEIAARGAGAAQIVVLFVRPPDVTDDWEKSELWSEAARIRDATLWVDDGGAEARRFGATTSGHALLFASDGHLLFSGGVTSSRGHPGESPGRAALLALLQGESAATTATPVFGCDLFDPAPSEDHDATHCDCHDPR